MSTTQDDATAAEPVAAVPPEIYLPTDCQPVKATSRDSYRPALRHAYLRRRDDGWWLLATDSYIALAINVQTAGEIVEGWVPRAVLKHMHGRGIYSAEQLSATAWKLVDGGTTMTFDVRAPTLDFPDLSKLGLWEYEAALGVSEIGMDPALTLRLSEGLGLKYVGVRLEFTTVDIKGAQVSPMRVTGGIHHFPERVGLQMPVKLDVKETA